MPQPLTNSLKNQANSSRTSRRSFLGKAAGAALVTIVPRHVLGGAGFLAPSERINLAGIGAGGMGGGDIATLARLGANVVALCDVDDERAAGSFRAFPKARRYKDFRVMLDKEAKNIDAVIGRHARPHPRRCHHGGHPRGQARLLPEAAHPHTPRMPRGDQGRPRGGRRDADGQPGHATEGARLTNEWIRAGVIGDGPRGPRLVGPSRPPLETRDRPAQRIRRRYRPTLDWDLWLGPIRERPYNPAYAPVNWRGWWDFGTGALGDMGCHIIDHPVWALDLGAPSAVEARATLDGSVLDGNKPNFETYPIASIIYYDFPERGSGRPCA